MRMGTLLGLVAASMLGTIGFHNVGYDNQAPRDLIEATRPSVVKKSKRGRKAHRGYSSNGSKMYHPNGGEKERNRFAGWPPGPMNNRTPGNHLPRLNADGIGFRKTGIDWSGALR